MYILTKRYLEEKKIDNDINKLEMRYKCCCPEDMNESYQ